MVLLMISAIFDKVLCIVCKITPPVVDSLNLNTNKLHD